LGSHNTETSNETANRNVHHHGLLSILGTQIQSNNSTCDDDDAGEAKEARRNDPFLHVLNAGHRRLLRGIHGDDDGSNDAVEATHLTNKAQTLLEEDGREYGTDDDREGTHGSYEDGVSKGVGDEIADFAYNHESHAEPPPGILEVAVAFACLLVVLFVGLQEAMLFDDE